MAFRGEFFAGAVDACGDGGDQVFGVVLVPSGSNEQRADKQKPASFPSYLPLKQKGGQERGGGTWPEHLPRMWIVLLELDLMLGDGVTALVENEEPRAGGAVVDGTDKRLVLRLDRRLYLGANHPHHRVSR